MTRRTALAAAGGAGVLLVGLVPWVSGWGGRRAVPTLVVTRGRFERRVLAEGNLEAATATPVTAPLEAAGSLKIAWLVPDGSRVRTGDVVVRFDATEMVKSLHNGESDRATAESRIAGLAAQSGGEIRNLERDGALAREELAAAEKYRIDDPEIFSRRDIVLSEIDHDLATRRIDSAEATKKVKESLAKVDLALLDIERRKAGIAIDRAAKGLDALEIKSPHDGLLVYRRNWRGEIARVGDSVWPGQPVAEIPDLATLQARVFVLEADAGGLAPGLPAQVTIEAHPDTVYGARIKAVDTLAKRRVGWIPVQYFGTTLALDRTDPATMKPGQRVSAELSLDARDNAIAIPRSAVFDKDGTKIVYREQGRRFVAVPVTLGPVGVGKVVVERGLEPGDVVALADPTGAPPEPKREGAGETSPAAIGDAR